ncbi:ribosome biogenesis GTPase YlqF [Caproiciproducens sp. NJN-50]|uniref:ribosome biogenesis GTPase YlqF n=1 Tax=Caproiciproducens sp. NJN-50 TaxID=2507162 RepID=UPI000FFE02AB|nr:ribosome biogenesis GTPase YlqF [Caproiciproducens sp. NJN-50]QAT49599.1 ribosome biogenesis GTPase YlqF [Caproiciproducens sp. NJN-50]
MQQSPPIQWFPGHMAKTKRQLEKDIRLVDAVAEILDARIPVSSRNPDLDRLTKGKPRMVLLNKADLADPASTKRWIAFLGERGLKAIAVDCHTGSGLNGFLPLAGKILADRLEAWKAKGMPGRRVRILVAGIPNVGKSSLINRLSRNSRASVEDRPGVTRSSQWFPVGKEMEILDTPGILWPKFDDPAVGERLAFTGAIKDEILDTETLACRLLEVLRDDYAGLLARRYRLENEMSDLSGGRLLELIGRKRGMLVGGGEVDTERASIMLLDEFRAGKIGRITLEKADE